MHRQTSNRKERGNMKKKSIFDELDEINNKLTTELEGKNYANMERQNRLQNAKAQLAVLESTEMQTYINGTEAELDELLLKKAALNDKIRILEMPLSDTEDNKASINNISLEMLELDRQSEREAKAELVEHLQAINDILTARNNVRVKVKQLNEKARNIYKITDYVPAISALDMDENEALKFKVELDRSRFYEKLLRRTIF
jgi:ERCC4-type nuclease